jgi:Na+-transporting NADH:ubiquinone oxidoreductase subunit NqrC
MSNIYIKAPKKELSILIPYNSGDGSAELTILQESDGTIDTISATALSGLTIKVNGVTSSVPFSLEVDDEILCNFTNAEADGTIRLSGIFNS